MSLNSATDYAIKVCDGSIVAGPHVRSACRRHLKDLETGADRGLRFNSAAADKVLRFCKDVIKLNGGVHEGKPFDPLPWQCFVLGSLFGWMRWDDEDGAWYRQFRMAFVETGKGSGKSPLAGAIGIFMLCADGEARAEIYAAASKKDQALVLFRDAVSMVKQSPALSSRLRLSGGAGREYNIAFLQKSAFFKPISSDDGQSGPRPHGALLDSFTNTKTLTWSR